MKLTNRNMQESIEVLQKAKESGKLGYAIARNLRRLKDAAKEYTETRDRLLQKYGTPIENKPGQVVLTSSAVKQIDAELAEIADIESEVDVCLVPEEIFVSGNLTSDQMAVLLWMVEEPVAKEAEESTDE